jgi:small subunit ribosomal protein S20
MPNTASAKKRHRQSEVRRLRNRAGRTAIKTQVRKVRDAVVAGNVEAGETEFRLAAKKLDQAAAKGLIHANVAGRTKSRLSSALKSAKAKKK